MIDAQKETTQATLAWLEQNQVGEFKFDGVSRRYTAEFNGDSKGVLLNKIGEVDIAFVAAKFCNHDVQTALKIAQARGASPAPN